MTETQLKNYYPLKQEVKHLVQLRATLQREAEEDKRRGWISAKESPFTALIVFYDQLIERHREELQEIEEAVAALPDCPGRDVLRLHYLEGLTMQQVCDALAYSWESVYRHRKKALALL